MPLDEPTITALLDAQGYTVPDDDLAEIAVTVNHLVEHALDWDALDLHDDEPWPQWPVGRADG